MHFHLPKPLHGWREFAGEVGIIVIGVLIALSAEQVVERIHLRGETRHARQALKAEIAFSYATAYERHLVHRCLNEQIDQIEKAILESGPRMTPLQIYHDGRGSYVYRAPSRSWNESSWDNVRGEEVFANLPDDTRDGLTRYYTQLDHMQRLNDEEDKTGGQLMAFDKPIPLDPSVKADVIQLLEGERSRNDLMDVIGSQMMAQADQLGDAASTQLLVEMRRESGTLQFCKSERLSV